MRFTLFTLMGPTPIGNLHLEVSQKLEEMGLGKTTPIEFERVGPNLITVKAVVEEIVPEPTSTFFNYEDENTGGNFYSDSFEGAEIEDPYF